MHIFESYSSRFEAEPFAHFSRTHFQDQAFRFGVLLAIVTGFVIPFSTSLTSVCSGGILLCWLLSGQYRVTFELLKRYRVATVALLFFAVLAVSLLYTPESLKHGARNLFKYRQFLMIPVYLSFFLDPKARQRGVQMFGLAMLLTLIASLSCWVFEIQGSARLLDHAVFKNRITQNILMAFLVYLSAWKFLEKPRQHWFYFVLALIAAINVIAMVPGRSGYLALGILTCLLMYQKLGFKSIVPAVICLGVVGGLAYSQSATFQKRINQVFTEIKEYKIAQIRRSGVNLRIEFYENSLHLAKSNPLLGSGTGSFGMKYKQLAEQNQQISTSNPHNEYMMLLVQNGIIGVGLFLSFFWSAWRSTRLMTGLDRALGQAVLAVYFVVCMVNSLMLDTTEGSLFGFLVGLTFAGGASALSRGGDSVPIVSSSDDEEPPVVCDAA